MSRNSTFGLCAASLCVVVFLCAAGGFAAPAPRIAIHTDDGKLPASFTPANVAAQLACFDAAKPAAQCSAWMMDVTDDGIPDVVILDESIVWVFSENPTGKWQAVGQWSLTGACAKFVDATRAGQFQAITPVRPRWPDLEIAGQRFAFREAAGPPPPCP